MMWTEKGFGMNDLYIIAVVIVTSVIYFWLPKMFSKQISVLIFLYCVGVAGIFDNSFGAKPFDFYDIMDGPAYTIMDVVVYFIYPPFGFLFLYLYKRLRVNNHYLIFYISIFTILAICMEWVSFKMGVFHYKSGYSIIYSACIYPIVQLILILFFNFIKENSQQTKIHSDHF